MKTVLIYRESLLPISETFIKAQTEAIKDFDVKFVGMYPDKPSLQLSNERALLVSSASRLSMERIRLYRWLPIAPDFHRKILSWRPGLVHAHFAVDGSNAVPLVRHLHLPLIVTLHGYDVTVKGNFARTYSRLWQQAKLFLCVSEFIRQQAISAGFPAEKLRLHYIGIDTRKFSVRSPEEEQPGKVVFIGRLTEKKGCTYLLSAMQLVQKQLPGASLTVIGDGPLRDSLEKQAMNLQLACTFLGRQSSEVVRTHLRSAALFCAPSVTAQNGDSEGLPITVLEAQALGVPVVATQHAGIPEAVEHGFSGLIATEKDVNGLAAHISRCLSSTRFRRACGRAGAESVRRKFDLMHQTTLLEDIYREVLRGHPYDQNHAAVYPA